jgi:hypothetical protein
MQVRTFGDRLGSAFWCTPGPGDRAEWQAVLQQSLTTYEQHLPDLEDREGRFALVHGNDIVVLATATAAIHEGNRRFGARPFLVKRISRTDIDRPRRTAPSQDVPAIS